MKKFAILLLILILALGVYFGVFYKKVPFWLENKYKTEIETIIDKWIPESKKIADNQVVIAKQYRDKIIKDKPTRQSDEYMNLALMSDFVMSESLLNMYGEIIKITSKYMYLDKNILCTDYYGGLANFIEPYLKKYGVDYSKLEDLENYAASKSKIVNEYLKEVENII